MNRPVSRALAGARLSRRSAIGRLASAGAVAAIATTHLGIAEGAARPVRSSIVSTQKGFAMTTASPTANPAPHQRCAVQHLPGQRGQARHAADGVLTVRRTRRRRRQPGLLLVLEPCRHAAGAASSSPIPARPAAARAPSDVPRGPGAHPRRGRRRSEDPPPGRGAPGRNGGPAGDLYVECHVAPHHLFGRDGHNLTIKVPVTFSEAALGGDIDVPTLDGPGVMLRLRPGTQSGSCASGQGQRHRHQQVDR